GIAYILKKYVWLAREQNPVLYPDKVSPHTLRHSKSMHLLEGGVNLVYIRDFLGHSSITTTEIYARANPEIKRKAIEEASASILPVTVQPCDWQKREIEKVFSSDYPHGNT
uniref:tyrosine-type recombinase/integrase n=1 Tax=Faecalibaculum rodentium TaxID=1702221 RepID=UPI0025A2B6D6